MTDVFNDFAKNLTTLNVNDVQLNLDNNYKNDDEMVSILTKKIQTDKIADTTIIQQNEISKKLQKICRCCLSENGELEFIYDADHCIATMLILITNLELFPGDGLPQNICAKCLTQLTDCINFRHQIETAQIILKHYITEGFQQGMILQEINCEQSVEQIGELCETHFANMEDTMLQTQTIAEISSPNSNPTNFYTEETEIVENLQISSNIIETSTSQIEMFSTDSLQKFGEEEIITKNQNENFQSLIECDNREIKIPEKETDSSDLTENKIESQITVQPSVEKNNQHTNTKANFSKENHNKLDQIYTHLLREQQNEEDVYKDLIICEQDEASHLKLYPDKVNDFKENNLQPLKITLIKDNLICEKCGKSYKDRKMYFRHIESHSKLYFCDYCKQSFRYQSIYRNHLRCHKDLNCTKDNNDDPSAKLYQCDKCDITFTLAVDLDVHGSLHDGDNICRKCGKKFPLFTKLKRHVSTHFEDKPHKCEICGLGFSEIASLTRHFRKHTDKKRDRKFSCKYCDKKYNDSHSLMVHTRNHTGEKPWICDICKKTFVDSRLRNSHMKIHSSEKQYECEICNKRFTHASTLKSHTRTHTGEKPYICGVCNKTFIQASNLNLHMRVHTGERPYQCKICDMAFASSSTLSSHIQTHTKEKPVLSCPVCGKKFSRRHINIHMRIHLGQKSYECEECLKKFRTSGQRNQHKKIHLRSKNFICEICEEKFSKARILNKHILDLHKENSEIKVTASKGKNILNNKEKSKRTTKIKQEQQTSEKISINTPFIQLNLHDQNRDLEDDSDYNESELLVNDLLAAVAGVSDDETHRDSDYNNEDG